MAVIDGATDSVSKTVSLGTHPQAIAIDEQSDQIYVANQSTANVTVIDGKTNSPVSEGGCGNDSVRLRRSTLSAHLVYVTNFSSNNVTVIRGPDHPMSAMAHTSLFPSSVQTTGDRSR